VVEGPLLDPALQSFIGHGPLPVRYALTIGELARFYNAELQIGAELEVMPLRGWRRELWFAQTGLIWVPPSPAMPHTSTTIVYVGTCLTEGTNLSEGRGTVLPFEVVGAPWLDGDALAESLNALHLDGVRCRATTFTPAGSKHAGQSCAGVQVHVTDRDVFRPLTVGLHLIAACRAQSPERFAFRPTSWEGKPPHFDLLIGDARVRPALAAGESVEALMQAWSADHARFEPLRRKYLLY
jgi:uncharacterized protein YbbC (DUF1343 family)